MTRIRTVLGYLVLTICIFVLGYLNHRSQAVLESDVSYATVDGMSLTLDIYHPPGWVWGKRHKTILFIHGGGWFTGDKSSFHDMAMGFASRGYVCFSANYRLVNGTKHTYPVQLDDVQLVVRWIRAHTFRYQTDAARIVVIGDSAGGHLVSQLGLLDTRDTHAELSHYSSRAQCVVDMYGPTDLTAPFPSTPAIRMQGAVNDFLAGTPASKPELARAASPLFEIGNSPAQFLIFHGGADPVVPVDQSRRFVRALQEKGVAVTYVEFPDEGHGISTPADLDKFAKMTAQFVHSCLP